MAEFQNILCEFRNANTEFLYKMLENLNISKIIDDIRVIEAMRKIRIEDFITLESINSLLPPHLKTKNFNDNIIKRILLQLFKNFYTYPYSSLPFYNDKKYSRTTGAPHLLGPIVQLLDVEENDQILILGAKCGYLESIIQDIDENIRIYIIEKVPQIFNITINNLERIGAMKNTKIINADPILSLDQFQEKRFDKILLTGYINTFPVFLFKSLKIGGLICGPIGKRMLQSFNRYFKTGKDMYDEEECYKNVIFSPLITDFFIPEGF